MNTDVQGCSLEHTGLQPLSRGCSLQPMLEREAHRQAHHVRRARCGDACPCRLVAPLQHREACLVHVRVGRMSCACTCACAYDVHAVCSARVCGMQCMQCTYSAHAVHMPVGRALRTPEEDSLASSLTW